MLATNSTWFFRFSIKKSGIQVEVSTLMESETPQKAWTTLINEQMTRHGITQSDIDILIMNKV